MHNKDEMNFTSRETENRGKRKGSVNSLARKFAFNNEV